MNHFPCIKRIITATTRDPRPGEIDGVHYYFLSNEAFEQKLAEDAFYEHALVHGRHYGTLKSEVHRHLMGGNDIILNIDVQGAAIVREKAKTDALMAARMKTIFIRPDSVDTIRARLKYRQSDSETEIERRLKTAIKELATAEQHDYILPSSTREQDFRLITSIYLAEKHRVVSANNP